MDTIALEKVLRETPVKFNFETGKEVAGGTNRC